MLNLLLFLMMPSKLFSILSGANPSRLLLILLLLFISSAGSGQQTQDAELQEMINRRADLLQEWRRFNLDENALFGGQSKKDLRNVLQVQQQIIELDNQI